jgi:hypothetical protein
MLIYHGVVEVILCEILVFNKKEKYLSTQKGSFVTEAEPNR